MTYRTLLIAAAFFGLTGVLLGAFGAHALQGYLPSGLIKAWQTAVLYQFIHSLALLGVSVLMIQKPGMKSLKLTGICFISGTLLFSGSLYLLALTQISKLGMITPIGGALFMLGWGTLLFTAWKWPINQPPQSPNN